VIRARGTPAETGVKKGPETALSGLHKSVSVKQPRKRQQTIYTKIWNYLETP